MFTGYDYLDTETRVLGILLDGQPVQRASAGDIAEVILAESSLYPEGGGQAADQGSIVGNGFDLEVLDVQRPVKGLISHTVQVTSGEVGVGDAATSVVDPLYRHAAAQAHSATHLIHAALRQTLGPEAHQSGSFNKAGYMRLDFSWNQGLSHETRSEVEEIANNAVRDNLEVTTRILPIAEAKAAGAMALFGEKYGDTVRMVDIGGPWSRELCAGIHVRSLGRGRSGEPDQRVVGRVDQPPRRGAGGSGCLPRPGSGAHDRLAADLDPEDPARAAARAHRRTGRGAQGRREEDRGVRGEQAVGSRSRTARADAIASASYRAVVEDVGELGFGRRPADSGRRPCASASASSAAVVALGRTIRRQAVGHRRDQRRPRASTGVKAGALAKQAAATLGGGGGGKDDLAQGGGSDVTAIGAALEGIRAALEGLRCGPASGSASTWASARVGVARMRPGRPARHPRRDPPT